MHRAIRYTLVSLFVVAVAGVLMTAALRPNSPTKWAAAGDMAGARADACAATLPDGRILVTGGANEDGVLAGAEFLRAPAEAPVPPPMSYARAEHSCVALPDGRVLVAGGRTNGGGALNAAEVFDPAANTWTIVGVMSAARAGATASSLPDGRVLIAGGESSGVATPTLEVFAPVAGQFTPVWGLLSSPRKDHAAAVLRDGRVLIAGGSDGSASLDTADIYDPATGEIHPAGKLAMRRAGLSATTLLDGRVLLAGGNNGEVDLASTELFDPASGRFAAGAVMDSPRRDHLAIRLPDNNQVLMVGGTSGGRPLADSALYVPWRNVFEPAGALLVPRTAAAAAALSGKVLLAGGRNAAGTITGTREVLSVPTIRTTDALGNTKLDFAPGETVHIRGTDWTAGAEVNLTVTEVTGRLPDGTPIYSTQPRWTATVTADANGLVSSAQLTPDKQLVMNATDAGKTFALTAREPSTGREAQVWVFTDEVNISTFAPDCTTGKTAFNLGDVVCAKATGLGGDTYHIEWFNPPPASALKWTSGNSTGGNLTDTRTPDSTGTWTVKVVRNSDSVVMATTTFTVTAAGPTKLAFTTSPFTAVVGQCAGPVTVQTQNASGTPTNPTSSTTVSLSTSGTGTFYTDSNCTTSTTSVTIPTSANSASFYYKGTAPGTPTLTASATGLTSATQNETINKASTTTTISSDTPDPSVVGQPYTVNYSVTVDSPGNGTPSGNVTVSDGSQTCTATVAAGTCSLTSTSAGAKTLTATYEGDSNFNASTSAGVGHDVNTRSTTTVVTFSNNPVVVGQTTTATVTVTDTDTGTKSSPAGTVTFASTVSSDVFNPVAKSCTLVLGTNGGLGTSTCTVDITPAEASVHNLTASYAPSTSPSVHSASNNNASPAGLTVNTRSTSTVVSLDPTSVVVGQATTATVTVTDTDSAGTKSSPAGKVTFASSVASDGFNPVTKDCTLVLGTNGSLGTSSCTVTITPAQASTHNITASYAASTSPSVHSGSSTVSAAALTVTTRSTSTVVSLDPTSVVVGQATTATVTVTDTESAGTKFSPAGKVTFASSVASDGFNPATKDCTLVLGTNGSLGTSTCTVTITPAEASTHNITASYAPSTSPSVHSSSSTVSAAALTVTTRSTSTVVSFDPTSVVVGQATTATVTVTDTGSAGTKSSPAGKVTFASSVASDGFNPATKDCTLVPGTNGSLGTSTCTVTITPAEASTHYITASYTASTSPSVHSSSSTTAPGAALTVNRRTTSTAVSLAPSTVVVGQPSTVNVTVTDIEVAGSKFSPSGAVAVSTGVASDVITGTCTLVLGTNGALGTSTCSVTVKPTVVNGGSRKVTATFPESPVHKSSEGSAALTVNQASTTTVVSSSKSPSTFGDSVTLTATITPQYPGGAALTGTVQFKDGGSDLGLPVTVSGGAASYTTSSLAAGTHNITATYSGDTNYLGSTNSPAFAQTVNPYTVTASVTVSPNPQQYSDKVTFTASLPNPLINGVPTTTAGTAVTFSVGTQQVGSCNLALVNGGSKFECTTALIALLEPTPFGTPPTGQMAPGPHTVTAAFAYINPNYTLAAGSNTTTLTITKEDARVSYTGPLFVATPCKDCATATLALSATVWDISATAEAAGDASEGDIRNATVSFVNRDAGNAVLCTSGVGLIDANVKTTGTAACAVTYNLGSLSSDSFDIGIVVNNYYTRNASDDDQTITVSKPSTANMITGGGYLVLTNSAGVKAGDPGKKNNFGFNVIYNKSGKNLQGRINSIIRRTEADGLHVYKIKGNMMDTLTVSPSPCPNATPGSPCTALYTGKANLQDVTNPLLPPISIVGGAILQVELTDKGEPGSAETISITLRDSKNGTLWFSSNWPATQRKPVEQPLGGGNLVVH